MKDGRGSTKRKIKPDVIVIAAVLLVALVSLLLIFVLRKPGGVAVVEVDGEVVGEYPLYQNGVYPLNGGTNVLVIENGVAYLSYSNCPDHTCERTGKIRFVGQTIVCLPNKLSVTVKGEAEGGVDLVS
ncbi:MAG: NusG domain II-containing protein [Clostridia bacterium]|nr:NusG domain II-containing protein [Clostridia bacterium]